MLNEKNNQLYKSLHKLLNQVYMFTYKKENYFFQSALDEFDRIEQLR